ncbi:GtrA family protein [Actinokineospora globicatena]|uniref:GtrA family protein n=1 Tax=Actinokineospora globicatena TaxID=103729 RepID=UPI0020A5B1C8|nr:GtrA family protein [Actinokineospora globicatena]MCP2302074.1 putative flippase GtrA (transmembrane translocase of bactoprenol-linked glucose) [Actinokineospora globicatena]GLW76264.1 sugar translocase [Actinokineospora globicatena]GLW83100.1 sugar translocase [Actinokineospora globicatena]
MAFVDTVLARLPQPVRSLLIKHREMLKFAVVGGVCFVVTNAVNYALKLTVLNRNPVTALIVAVIIATIVSYILNREWSFRDRGGRERPHEAALFFLISGIGVGLNALPLWVSRYLFDLEVPHVTLLTQEIADFGFGIILGTLIAMVFRWWAFKKWVFPEAEGRVRPLRVVPTDEDEQAA